MSCTRCEESACWIKAMNPKCGTGSLAIYECSAKLRESKAEADKKYDRVKEPHQEGTATYENHDSAKMKIRADHGQAQH
jgi:hypothetical protein